MRAREKAILALCMGAVFSLMSPAAEERKDEKTTEWSFDPSSLKPFTAIHKYLNQHQTGLYPDGKNEMPEAHRRAGEQMASEIKPLDISGKPNAEGGRIVALAMGHSNCREYFKAFADHLQKNKAELNAKFELVSAAVDGNQLQQIRNFRGDVWRKANELMSRPGYSSNQVQILFLHTTYHGAANQAKAAPDDFPAKMKRMQEDLAAVLQHCAEVYPHLKIAYVTCDGFRHFTRFEPHVWREAFAFKWLIEDQIRGANELAFKGENRKVPWLEWGPYIWDNAWDRSCFTDGVHPAQKAKDIFVEKYWTHLKGDSVAKGWLFND